jgi:ribosomal protein S18 acetylase RimI-like enzyme
METRYLKRFRMEIDFRQAPAERAALPEGYRWQAWHPRLLRSHAAAKFASFEQELDSQLFLSLASTSGCEELMRGIVHHPGFLPQATWLIEFTGNGFANPLPCGTIQGLAHSTTLGSVQNVGVAPEHRGLGLGRALVLKSLAGFRRFGLLRVYLDVTADNEPAVELYRAVGFRVVSTSYKELPRPIPAVAGRSR